METDDKKNFRDKLVNLTSFFLKESLMKKTEKFTKQFDLEIKYHLKSMEDIASKGGSFYDLQNVHDPVNNTVHIGDSILKNLVKNDEFLFGLFVDKMREYNLECKIVDCDFPTKIVRIFWG